MRARFLPHVLIVLALLLSPSATVASAALANTPSQPPVNPSGILGPFTGEPIYPHVWNGDLRDLPQIGEPGSLADDAPEIMSVRLTPAEIAARNAQGAQRAAALQSQLAGEEPAPPPIANFEGMSRTASCPPGSCGAGWPPDTVGDVGPNHYIQMVNTSIAIFDKATGTRLVGTTLNNFFTGPAGTPCDTSNRGDVVVLYDPLVDRWVVTDFAWFNFNTGPWYQCVAVSQTGDPVAGGWYFYAMQANSGVFAAYFNDYPKLGVWPDAYYMSANMFEPAGSGFGVRLWAINKTPLLTGGPLQEVHFDLCLDGSCGSFLPSNLRGTPPPAGSPNYFANLTGLNSFDMYRFQADFVTPANSTLTGPISVPIAPYNLYGSAIPQPGTAQGLDSLSDRLMMQLQYRNMGTHEALWATHTVDEGGLAVARWYEVRDPAGTPTLFQQGSVNPGDGINRWMASIAADQDGNAAIGYSVSNSSVYPGIRYAGRLNGEIPGQLPQTEQVLINGTGSQTGIDRWGDYSAMSVDPNDDCTFWYTQEYYATTGSNWQTRIGSFKFPACGQPKGTIAGRVVDSVTSAGIPNAPVIIAGVTEMAAIVQTDATGHYTMQVLPGTYAVTAGPLLPGYPTQNSAASQVVVAGSTTSVPDIPLTGVPNLVYTAVTVNDTTGNGNSNGSPDPGESSVQLFVSLSNNGAATSDGINAVLSTTTAGVAVTQSASPYPNIAAGGSQANSTAYVISLESTLICGTVMQFELAVTTAQGSYSFPFSIQASVPQPPANAYFDDFENGANGWATGGTGNTWAQVTSQSYSPTHSWTDSPSGNYANNVNSWLQSPVIDLTGKVGIVVSAYTTYALESGFDFVYLEWSTDGGATWNAAPLASFNGIQATWTQTASPAAALDNQSNARLRYRFVSDTGVVADGFYVDDFAVTYTPIVCEPPIGTAVELSDLSASAGQSTAPTGALLAALVAAGLATVAIFLRQRAVASD